MKMSKNRVFFPPSDRPILSHSAATVVRPPSVQTLKIKINLAGYDLHSRTILKNNCSRDRRKQRASSASPASRRSSTRGAPPSPPPLRSFSNKYFFGGNLHKLFLLTYHHYIHHHNTDQLSSALLPTKNIQREKETVSGSSKLKVCRSKTKKMFFNSFLYLAAIESPQLIALEILASRDGILAPKRKKSPLKGIPLFVPRMKFHLYPCGHRPRALAQGSCGRKNSLRNRRISSSSSPLLPVTAAGTMSKSMTMCVLGRRGGGTVLRSGEEDLVLGRR